MVSRIQSQHNKLELKNDNYAEIKLNDSNIVEFDDPIEKKNELLFETDYIFQKELKQTFGQKLENIHLKFGIPSHKEQLMARALKLSVSEILKNTKEFHFKLSKVPVQVQDFK